MGWQGWAAQGNAGLAVCVRVCACRGLLSDFCHGLIPSRTIRCVFCVHSFGSLGFGDHALYDLWHILEGRRKKISSPQALRDHGLAQGRLSPGSWQNEETPGRSKLGRKVL